jgi:ubiquinone biosynthesis protein
VNALLVVVVSLFNAVVIGFVARRLLGVPVGWPRTILVSLLVNSLGAPVITWVVDALGLQVDQQRPTQVTLAAGLVLALSAAWVLAGEVAVLAVLEAVFPTGSLPRLGPTLRGLPARGRRARRYLEITRIAATHGLATYLRPRRTRQSGAADPGRSVARSVRLALTERGVTFVKLGQMLSTRADLLPGDFIAELSQLQSDAPPEPWQAIRIAIERDLGRPVETVFADVSAEPLAAASVAQIHRATLLDGTDVVVKVQRPGARAQVTADLDIALRLADRLERTTSWGRRLGLRDLANGFAASLREELDYGVEMANMAAVAAAGTDVVVPRTYPGLSSPRLLVMERLHGQPLSRAADLLAGIEPAMRADMAERLFAAVLRQVLASGTFHADLHPGNIVVDRDGSVGLLDFGSVGRLDRAGRRSLGLLLAASTRQDSIGATDALLDLLDHPAALDDRRLERDVGQLISRYGHGIGSQGGGELFAALFDVVVRHGLRVPPSVAAAFRSLGALQGSLLLLSADLDVATSAQAQARLLIAEQVTPRSARDELEGQLAAVLPLLQRMPRRINRLTEDLEAGRLTVGVRALGHPDDRALLVGIMQQVVVSVLAGALALCGVVLLVSEGGPMMTPTIRLWAFLGFVLLFFAFVLGARVLALVFRQGTRSL